MAGVIPTLGRSVVGSGPANLRPRGLRKRRPTSGRTTRLGVVHRSQPGERVNRQDCLPGVLSASSLGGRCRFRGRRFPASPGAANGGGGDRGWTGSSARGEFASVDRAPAARRANPDRPGCRSDASPGVLPKNHKARPRFRVDLSDAPGPEMKRCGRLSDPGVR